MDCTLKTATAARLVNRSTTEFLSIMEAAAIRPKPIAFLGRPTQHWALTDIENVFGRFFTEEEIEHALEPDRRRARNVRRYCENRRLSTIPARQAAFSYRGMDYQAAMAVIDEFIQRTGS
jgi:hypothetical protein